MQADVQFFIIMVIIISLIEQKQNLIILQYFQRFFLFKSLFDHFQLFLPMKFVMFYSKKLMLK